MFDVEARSLSLGLKFTAGSSKLRFEDMFEVEVLNVIRNGSLKLML